MRGRKDDQVLFELHFARANPSDFRLDCSGRVRGCPETLSDLTELSEHEAYGGELEESERIAVEVLPVLGQSAAAIEPGDAALDDPALGQRDEASAPIGPLDDLGFEMREDAGQRTVKQRPFIGAVGEHLSQEGEQVEHAPQGARGRRRGPERRRR